AGDAERTALALGRAGDAPRAGGAGAAEPPAPQAAAAEAAAAKATPAADGPANAAAAGSPAAGRAGGGAQEELLEGEQRVGRVGPPQREDVDLRAGRGHDVQLADQGEHEVDRLCRR